MGGGEEGSGGVGIEGEDEGRGMLMGEKWGVGSGDEEEEEMWLS